MSEIEETAFFGCTNITSATLNNYYAIKNFKTVFSTIFDNIKAITIGDDVSEISNFAFKGCSKLNSISLGDNIELIGDSAFSDCVELSTVTIPNKVNMIYRSAFSNCETLNNVNILGNLNYVVQEAFADCTKLNNFIYSGTKAPSYDDPGKNVFSNCPQLDKVSVPKNYEGKTFCGHKTTKGMSAQEWLQEYITWWVYLTLAVIGFVLGRNWPGIVNKIKNCWINHCRCCRNRHRDSLSASLTDQSTF